ncbi:MAG: hypothetical protein C4519_02300 [Desulfobacteraceae bacterium]|nr:MAG: hypothetical protein C4519_02300 [Desulfobacteraceae bacterium]
MGYLPHIPKRLIGINKENRFGKGFSAGAGIILNSLISQALRSRPKSLETASSKIFSHVETLLEWKKPDAQDTFSSDLSFFFDKLIKGLIVNTVKQPCQIGIRPHSPTLRIYAPTGYAKSYLQGLLRTHAAKMSRRQWLFELSAVAVR